MGVFSKDIQSMDDLLLHGLQDMYYAENQIVKALPKMATAASHDELQAALGEHLKETRTHVADLTANFGIRGLGNEEQEFADKRFKGRPNYFYVEGGYELVQSLPWWSTALALDLRGQWAPQPLISNEQFATGGRDSVRGYYDGEILGDYGVQASAEWRSQ